MHTYFNDNQNLPKTGNKPEAIPIIQHFEQCLQENESITRSFQATLPQIVWLTAVNQSILNFHQGCYEYSGNSAGKLLIWEFINCLSLSQCNFIVFFGSCSSKAPQSFKTTRCILSTNSAYWAKFLCTTKGE